MPEVEPFEARLAAAVHAFADRAETKVDAMEVAERVVGRRRVGTFAWLGRPLPVAASVLVTLAPAARAPRLVRPGGRSVGPALVRRAAAGPDRDPHGGPDGSRDSDHDAHARANHRRGGPRARHRDRGRLGADLRDVGAACDGVTQMRGVVATTVDTMNDPRVTGTGVIHGENDSYGSVGPQWGTYRLENADGAWEGTWTGALWGDGMVSDVTAWLVGSGAYEGYTYYFHARGVTTMKVEGIVFPGSPPAP